VSEANNRIVESYVQVIIDTGFFVVIVLDNGKKYQSQCFSNLYRAFEMRFDFGEGTEILFDEIDQFDEISVKEMIAR